MKFLGLDYLMSPGTSRTQQLEDNTLISDEMLHDMMSDPTLQRIENWMQLDGEKDSYFAFDPSIFNVDMSAGNAFHCTPFCPLIFT